ncbi:MAG: hypothetical protein IT375_11760 [Polyangiaceae bacterium]|nr:hypothetical protein [Polyangiaceae bacterium]
MIKSPALAASSAAASAVTFVTFTALGAAGWVRGTGRVLAVAVFVALPPSGSVALSSIS